MATSQTFPELRWGSERTPLRRQMLWFGATRPGSWLVRTLTPLDRRILVRSKGRYTLLGPFGLPVLLLTATGATTGLPRTTPLLYARDGDDLLVAGSNFGQAHHPAWSSNLLANPEAVVTIAGTAVPAIATPLHGDEAVSAYRKLEQVAGAYTVYRSRTDREIRVFRLSAA